MASVPPDALDAVIRIGNKNNEWYGTGFLYASQYKDTYLPVLVTNRHIIDNLNDDNENVIRLKYVCFDTDIVHLYDIALFDDEDNPNFYCHHDKEIDVAIIPVNYGELKKMGLEIITHDVSSRTKEMEEIGVSEGDPINVLGFPMVDLSPNFSESVIARNGSIARIRDLFYGKSKYFLLDCFIFPGNSGGPVISLPQHTAISGTKRIEKAQLIGIVKEYLAYEDIAKSIQTGETRVIFTENSGLTLVHPMDCVEEVINIYKNKKKIKDHL